MWKRNLDLIQKDKKLLASTEMEIFRGAAGYTLFDHKRNEEIWEEMKVEPVGEKLSRYKSNWLRHVTRMNSNRVPEIVLNFWQNEQRRLEIP
jgi:hypothetical protein